MEKSIKPVLAIVIPCYDEQEVLTETAKKLSDKLQQFVSKQIINEKSLLLFVDDGSNDNTWSLIEKFNAENSFIFNGIKLTGNRGHQNALLCGLLTVKDHIDAAISIDADLQDDLDVIGKMTEKFRDVYEIVYRVRSNRKMDSFLKRTTAQGFYRFMRILGVVIIYNHADFRLMGRNALEALEKYSEVNLFLRGIIPLLGFETGIEYYTRSERLAGTSKYPPGKMLQFAFEGITSFSIKLLRFIACSIWGIGGLILFSVGIAGEYIGKIYLEVKHRLRFHAEKILYDGKNAAL
jgi:glycosyltransferase involved in cell wall biosynthesis